MANLTKKTAFFELLQSTIEIYSKNFLFLTGLVSVFFLITFAVELANNFLNLQPLIMQYGAAVFVVYLLVAILVRWFIQAMTVAGLTRGSIHAEQGKKGFGEVLNYAFTNCVRVFILNFKIFIYTGAWAFLLFIFMAMMPIFMGVLSIKGVSGAGQEATIKAMTDFVTLVGPMIGFAGIAAFLTGIVVIIRSFDIAFAMPLLIGKDGISARDAIAESKKLAAQRKGRIFGNGFLIAVVMGIIYIPLIKLSAYILSYIIPQGNMSVLAYVDLTNGFSYILPSLIAPVIANIFHVEFTKKTMEEEGQTFPVLKA